MLPQDFFRLSLVFVLCRLTELVVGASTKKFTEDASFLKVLNLNTWGLNWPWSEEREVRFRALRDELFRGSYDVVLLQEVWLRKDYDIIRFAMPYTTYYETVNGNCLGSVLPLGCSGLLIMSKHPIDYVQFFPFEYKGSFWNFDGEIFVTKGVVKARVLWENYTLDVFTTHMISYTNNPDVDNASVRHMQALQTADIIRSSDAEIKVFGGDLNALPHPQQSQPYRILTAAMTDSLVDMYPGASFHPWFATFGNERNTYTRHLLSERIDYLMYNSVPNVAMKTFEFYTPALMAEKCDGSVVSLSDHEAIVATFIVERKAKKRATSTQPPTQTVPNYPQLTETFSDGNGDNVKENITDIDTNELSYVRRFSYT